MEENLSTIPLKAITAIKAGKMVLVTDDEDRENEGDLIMAELCTLKLLTWLRSSRFNLHACCWRLWTSCNLVLWLAKTLITVNCFLVSIDH